MTQKTRHWLSLVTVSVATFFGLARVQAQCAVCTVALVGGLGISRMLGVDDTYVGVWLGAAIIAVSGFAGGLLVKRYPSKRWLRPVAQTVIIAIFAVALYFVDGYVRDVPRFCETEPCPPGHALSSLSQGMIIGIIMICLGLYLDKALRVLKDDGGKPYFPFQKVVMPVCMVILGTLGAWILVG